MSSLNDFRLSWNGQSSNDYVNFHKIETTNSSHRTVKIGNHQYQLSGNQERVDFLVERFADRSLGSITSIADLVNKIKGLDKDKPSITKIHTVALNELQNINSNSLHKKISEYLNKLEKCACFSGVVEVTYEDNKRRTLITKGSDSTQPSFNHQTPLNVMSIGKVFTAIAVMQLVEQGKIDLNGPIHQYLRPNDYSLEEADNIYQHDMKAKNQENEKPYKESLEKFRTNEQITVKDLLAHTSGLVGDPGTGYHFDENQIGKWNYSNYGFQLLSRIVQNCSNDTSFVDYVQKNIFSDPNTNIELMPGALAYSKKLPEYDAATPHQVFRGELRSLDASTKGVKLPPPDGNGCWWMTANDLTRFAKAFVENKYFSSPKSQEAMISPIISRTPDGFLQQGLGFWVAPGNPSAFLAQGSFGGRSAIVCVIEAEKPIIISCVSNCSDGSNFFAEIIKLARGEEVNRPLNESQKNGEIDQKAYDWMIKQEPPYNNSTITDFVKTTGLPKHVIGLLANDLELEKPELAALLRSINS